MNWVPGCLNENCRNLDIFSMVISHAFMMPFSLQLSKIRTSHQIYGIFLKDHQLLWWITHYTDVIMVTIASQFTSVMIVYSTVYSDVDQRKHQSSTSLAFVWGIHRGPVNSPHKWPVTWKMLPFDYVIIEFPLLAVHQIRPAVLQTVHLITPGGGSQPPIPQVTRNLSP